MGKVLLDKFPSKLLFLRRSIVFPFRKEQSQLVGNVHEFLRIGGVNLPDLAVGASVLSAEMIASGTAT